MDEAAKMQNGYHSSGASGSIYASGFKELEANGDSKIVNGSMTYSPPASKEDESKWGQNGAADAKICPKNHICHNCCYSYYGNSSIFYGAQDTYVPQSSRKFTKHQSTYNSEAVMDETGTETTGGLWQGSYHY